MRFQTILTLLTLAIGLSFARGADTKQKLEVPMLRSAAVGIMDGATPQVVGSAKPFTREQVQAMVRDGLGDETGAKAIERRGIDFVPDGDFIQNLKGAGASDALIDALRAAKRPEPAGAKKPITQVQIFALLAGGVPNHRVSMLVQERSKDFEATDDYLRQIRLAGGDDELIGVLKNPAYTVIAEQVRKGPDPEVQQHAARAAAFMRDKRYSEAESEYRAAIRLAPEDPDLHFGLGYTLAQEGNWNAGISEYRETLRLNPKNEYAHVDLGSALGNTGDPDGAIAEYREGLNLNPNNETAHVGLGVALSRKGDLDGAITEYRAALRLNPNNELAHFGLGSTLGNKGDTPGAIQEYREALRVNPNNELAHFGLGSALGNSGDPDGAAMEYRQALRLNPNNELAHFGLGIALGTKGDLDGAITEYRTALQLNPNNANTHYYLAFALEQKGDRLGALGEYRSAYMLDPKNATFQQNYQRLLQQGSQ